MAVYQLEGGKERYILTKEEYVFLTRRADIVESLVDLVAQKLVDIPKNEERINEALEKLNKELT